ncbi:MAG TPA: class I tRNA ligase family protein [Solirubrobacterales bacterium]
MSSARSSYDASAVEAERQAAWARDDAFATPTPADGDRGVYIKPSSPFTSGKLHMGHVRDYSIGDAYARFRRARGDAVLFGFGFDAFGLPAEMAAIERKVPPAEWVEGCGERMLGQMKRLGFSFDYDRVFYSSDEEQYRWSQWLFLTLLEAGFIYRDDTTVDWCDSCRTTLAALQVEDGRCWRCHNEVRLIRRPTWFLRITPYLEENDRRLADLEDWDEISLSTQQYILGRSDGVEVELPGPDGEGVAVFTPHGDAVAEASFVMLSPRHPSVEGWAADPTVREQLDALRSGGWERSARDAKSVPLVDTGASVRAPWAPDPLPVLVSPIVDARYGPTAAFGVPSADEADASIAARVARVGEAPASGSGGQVTGAREAVRYRAADFSISRQRFWGTPIPIVHCDACGTVPVPVEDLPVVLPRDVEPTGEGNPLAELASFVDVACPRCDAPAKRETDTLDCHFDALWLWVPAAVPPEGRAESMFDHPELRTWLPSERLVAGSDSGGFVFDQRVVTKALRDIGPFAFMAEGEPFSGCLFHEMVIADGRKMSKHLGNVVDPDELVERYGADTVRLAILYAAGPAKTLNWNDGALRFCGRFLRGVWAYSHERFEGAARAPEDPEAATDTAFLRERLCKWSDNGLARITADLEELQMHKAVRNVTRLFERIQDFEKRVVARRGELSRADAEAQVAALLLLARVLIPFAPHTGEALLLAGGADAGELPGQWPERLALPTASSGAGTS